MRNRAPTPEVKTRFKIYGERSEATKDQQRVVTTVTDDRAGKHLRQQLAQQQLLHNEATRADRLAAQAKDIDAILYGSLMDIIDIEEDDSEVEPIRETMISAINMATDANGQYNRVPFYEIAHNMLINAFPLMDADARFHLIKPVAEYMSKVRAREQRQGEVKHDAEDDRDQTRLLHRQGDNCGGDPWEAPPSPRQPRIKEGGGKSSTSKPESSESLRPDTSMAAEVMGGIRSLIEIIAGQKSGKEKTSKDKVSIKSSSIEFECNRGVVATTRYLSSMEI